MIIHRKLYKDILEVLPVLCVDIALVHQGKYILVKRSNHPKKDLWWVPGGRVHKGETVENACHRKVKEELNIEITNLRLIGYYEDLYENNDFELEDMIHTVSIVFEATTKSLDITLDDQSSDWDFFDNLPKEFKIKQYGEL